MMEQNEFLRKIISLLEQAAIPYMISGSIGSSFHGQPRATNDADIVVDPTQKQLLAFVESLGSDYYVSRQAALDALEHRTMFNVIGVQSGFKADLILRKKRPYSKLEFQRKIRSELFGIPVYVLAPEDSILSKLEWSKGRRSQPQFNDALGVLTVQKDKLDFAYLKKWAKELGIGDTLDRLIEEMEKSD